VGPLCARTTKFGLVIIKALGLDLTAPALAWGLSLPA